MAINKLTMNDQLVYNMPGAPPPDAAPDVVHIDPQQPDLTWTPDSSKLKANREVVGVDNGWGEAYGKATELYNKHRKYSKQSNPWHLSLS